MSSFSNRDEMLDELIRTRIKRDKFPNKELETNYTREAYNYLTYYRDKRPHNDLSAFEHEEEYLKRKITALDLSNDRPDTMLWESDTAKALNDLSKKYPLSHYKHTFPFYYPGYSIENKNLKQFLLRNIDFDNWIYMKAEKLQYQFYYAAVIAAMYLNDPFSAAFYGECATKSRERTIENPNMVELFDTDEELRNLNDYLFDNRLSGTEFRQALQELSSATGV